ncbi:CCG-binding protein 1 [Durio zibethinus]|uniref:CCG-binding protein 1 n=1 Tax=Durio zibethinus TaxID=66656 RepID=A0A6P6AEN5_DURZI|nr:CCG-binding protein 1 [Durio zibethinus]
MINSILLRSSSSPLLVDVKDIDHTGLPPSSKTRFASTIRCSSSRDVYIPKLAPFNSTKLERYLKEPPLIEKTKNELTDYCTTLEGDDCYRCWRAYFELKDLEREMPKEDLEKLILKAESVESLIGFVHGVASIYNKGNDNWLSSMAKPLHSEDEGKKFFHIPDGLPKSAEEIEEEERATMPDSPYTRFLRVKGPFPAWYSRT